MALPFNSSTIDLNRFHKAVQDGFQNIPTCCIYKRASISVINSDRRYNEGDAFLDRIIT